MKRNIIKLAVVALTVFSCQADPVTWGDTGDGYYRNPVLLAQTSDGHIYYSPNEGISWIRRR